MSERDGGAPTRTIRVSRFKRDGGDAHVEDHEVPVDERTTVLEALRWIRVHDDPSLGIRHSCYHASCGTCGMLVNGREALACVTAVAALEDGPVRVEPLANLPVLEDLVVDMASFYGRFPPSHPIVRASEANPDATPPAEVGAYARFEDCIE